MSYFNKRQLLQDLEISEVSAVDHPANSSTDPITGKKRPHALIALFKRDDNYQQPSTDKESPVESLEQIMKSSNVKTRSQLVDAMKAAAQKVAKNDPGASLERIESDLWTPEATAAYENLPKRFVGQPAQNPTRLLVVLRSNSIPALPKSKRVPA